MLDFSKIKAQFEKPVKPSEIFMSLARKDGKYSYLRSVQSDVLSKWWEHRDNEVNIIKMNTGSGKTVTALLMLQSLLNENKGNVVYVVPNNYLVEQVCAQAKSLGINVQTNYDDLDFKNKNAILVTSIYTLFNGKSVFGMRDYNNIVIDNIVIDDVHSCLGIIEDNCTLKIPSSDNCYNDFFNLFKTELSSYSDISAEFLMSRIEDGTPLFVPFWIWQKHIADIQTIMLNYKDLDYYKFQYQLIKDNLKLCRCFIRNNQLEIIPYCVPIHKITSYINAKRKIFLSATLPDDTVFPSVLNVKEDKLNNIISPESASDIGERMIMFPQMINPNIKEDDIRLRVKAISKKYNVVVLVPSNRQAEKWKELSDKILSSDSFQKDINSISNQQHGLYIVVNRYDGIDLPDSACRLLVIDGLPNLHNSYDLFEQKALSSSKRINVELMQKIEQGMGRGVRSNTDFCAILLMDNKLINTIYNNEAKKFFSPATLKQMEISEALWSDLKSQNADIDEIFKAYEYLFDRNQDWIDTNKSGLISCRYSIKPKLNNLQLVIRKAYNEAIYEDYKKAFSILDDFQNELKNDENRNEEIGYIKMLMSEYLNQQDTSKAQELLLSAYRQNFNILKPVVGISYSKLLKTNKQAESIMNFLGMFKQEKNRIIIKVNSVLDDLIFKKDNANIFENAVYEIFGALGVWSQRPEKEYGKGPDNLLALEESYLIIECKSGSTAEQVSKSDSQQLNESISWFKSKYGADENYTPIHIHPSSIYSYQCSPDNRTKILTKKELETLKTAVSKFYRELLNQNSDIGISDINRLLAANKLLLTNIINYFIPYKIATSK